MGYLQRNKNKENEPKNQPVSTRLTKSELDQFNKLCFETGYTLAEALRILVKKEINGEEDVLLSSRLQKNTAVNVLNTDVNVLHTDVNNLKTAVNKPYTNVNKKPVRSGAARFTTGDWNVDNFLPCPVCNTWINAPNFARHAKRHEMTSREIFEKHKEKADKMVQEKQSKIKL